MVQVKKEYHPNTDHQPLYDRLFEDVYSKFYDQVQTLIHQASGIIKAYS